MTLTDQFLYDFNSTFFFPLTHHCLLSSLLYSFLDIFSPSSWSASTPPTPRPPPYLPTCLNKKSCSAFLSRSSRSSCSWTSRGSCLMTSPRNGPGSWAEVEEREEQEEEEAEEGSPWCCLSSSSVSSGWLWCCLAAAETPEPETCSLGLEMIWENRTRTV